MNVQSVVVLNGVTWKDFSPRFIQSFLKIFTEGAVTTEVGCLIQYFITLTTRYLRTYGFKITQKPTESLKCIATYEAVHLEAAEQSAQNPMLVSACGGQAGRHAHERT